MKTNLFTIILLLLIPAFLHASDLRKYKLVVCQEKDVSQSELKFYRFQNDTYNVHYVNNANRLYEIYVMKAVREGFLTVSVSADKEYVSLDYMTKFYLIPPYFYVEWKLRNGRNCKKQYQIIHRENGVLYCRHKESFFPKPPDPYKRWQR